LRLFRNLHETRRDLQVSNSDNDFFFLVKRAQTKNRKKKKKKNLNPTSNENSSYLRVSGIDYNFT